MKSRAKVSTVAVLDLIDHLIDRQLLDENALANHSLSLYQRYKKGFSDSSTQEPIQEPIQEQRIDEHHFIWLWHQLDAVDSLSEKIRHAWDIGRIIRPHANGILAHWISHCDTLNEALTVFTHNIKLMNPSELWSVEHNQSTLLITLDFQQEKHYPLIAPIRSASALLSWIAYLSGKSIRPCQVILPAKLKPFQAQLDALLLCPTQYQGRLLTLVFHEQDLQTAIRFSNPYLKTMLKQKATRLSEALPNQNTISNNINTLLANDLPYYSCIEHCCKALNMSRSTLFRKLKLEQTTYTHLLEQARINQFQQWSGANHSKVDMSEKLGFSDISSFYKFLKKIPDNPE